MVVKEKLNTAMVSSIFWWSTGIVCFMYSVYCRSFAKLHVNIPGTYIPLFIGEILLALGIILCVIRFKQNPLRHHWSHWGVGVFFLWVLMKVLWGFFEEGPLALRNAALFYYAAFGVVGYVMFDRACYQATRYLIFVILMVVPLTVHFDGYYLYPYFALALMFILRQSNLLYRIIGVGLLFLVFPYRLFFQDSKNIVLGNMAAFAFLFLVICVWNIHRISNRWRWGLPVLLGSVLFSGFLCFSGDIKLKTMTNPRRIIHLFKEYDVMFKERYGNYHQKEIAANIFNGYRDTASHFLYKLGVVPERPFGESQMTLTMDYKQQKGKIDTKKLDEAFDFAQRKIEYSLRHAALIEAQEKTAQNASKDKIPSRDMYEVDASKDILKKMMDIQVSKDSQKYDHVLTEQQINEQKQKLIKQAAQLLDRIDNYADPNVVATQGRTLDTDYVNIIFRLLIWRDMIVEFIKEKPVFGFSFGKPQRSISLEVLNIAVGEWSRDGWIMPHNSYLNFIYRGGIVGVAMIIFLAISFYKLAVFFISHRSLPGVMLTSILVYWLTIAHFTVFFEFPYQAILFWTLFGMLWAYKKQYNKKVNI